MIREFEGVFEPSYQSIHSIEHIVDTVEFLFEQRCPNCGANCFKMVAWSADRDWETHLQIL